MNPLERACRAAHDEHNGDANARALAADPAWDGWKSWIPVARAVLTAIREPSGAMIKAVSEGGFWFDDRVERDWQTMIDAALAEEG